MTLAERLAQAEEAYHQLMIGQSAIELRDQNGELIRYSPANANKLAQYIEDLKRQLGLTSNGPLKVLM